MTIIIDTNELRGIATLLEGRSVVSQIHFDINTPLNFRPIRECVPDSLVIKLDNGFKMRFDHTQIGRLSGRCYKEDTVSVTLTLKISNFC